MFGWFQNKKAPSLPAPTTPEIKSEPLPKSHERIVHVGFIVGHDKKEQGAVMKHPSGLSEYEYNKQLANKLIELSVNYPKLKVSVILRDGVGIYGAYKKAEEAGCDCVIELHFNATENHIAKGSVTLTTPDLNDVEFSHIIHQQICLAFSRQGESLGVQVIGRSVRGAPNVYAFPNGVNCLVEPFFGDSEPELGIQNDMVYAKALLNGVMQWSHKMDLLSPSGKLP